MKTDPLSLPPRPRLTQNAVFWPAAGVYLKSTHGHDFTGHSMVVAGIPQELAIDGGLEMRRVIFSGNPVYEDFSLWSDSPFEEVCQKILWGTYGPKGDQPRRWVPLKECETEHLQAILRTQLHVYGGVVERVIKHILKERGVKPAEIEPFKAPVLLPKYQVLVDGDRLCKGVIFAGESPTKKPVKKPIKKPAAKRKARK